MSSSMRWQFRHEFDKFCTDNNIIHELSSPYNPESNGLAESAMKTMMSLVITCKMQKESLTKDIAARCNMSREDGTSPSKHSSEEDKDMSHLCLQTS